MLNGPVMPAAGYKEYADKDPSGSCVGIQLMHLRLEFFQLSPL